ncbi:MAG TPA: hypothetical protein VHL11_11930, partial [Phototrophicaceae bacterium]|nr:hypothetical protein [Phototrophicaceae bacterium]
MPIHHHWDDEDHTILIYTYEGNWTLEEYHKAVDLNYDLVNGEPHPVDLILDFTKSGSGATQLLSAARHAERKVAPNQRLFVSVKIPGFVRAVAEMALKFVPSLREKMRNASTLEEARMIIKHYRQGLEEKQKSEEKHPDSHSKRRVR